MLRKIFVCTVLMFIAISYGQVLSEARAVPKMLNYQGYLTDTLGNPMTILGCHMVFAIYNMADGGDVLWLEERWIDVERGIFNVILGIGVPIPDSVFRTGIDRWLQLYVNGQVQSPRTRITAMAYAYTATYADTADYAKSAVADTDWIIVGDNMYSGISGNVGIGTTNPSDSAKLRVKSNNLYAGLFTSDSLTPNTHVIHSEFTGSGNYDAVAVYGKSIPADFHGTGGYFEGGYAGVQGLVEPTGANVYYGVLGKVNGGSGLNHGLYGEATGAGTNYGVYGYAGGAGTNWGGFFLGDGYFSGKVGIGTMNPSDSTKLHVESNDLYAGLFTSDNPDYHTHVVHSEYTGSGNYEAVAVWGECVPAEDYGWGGVFEGGHFGVRGFVSPTGDHQYFGATGEVSGGSGENFGVHGYAYGSGTNYGVYGWAAGGDTNWAGYFAGNGYFRDNLAIGTWGPSSETKVHIRAVTDDFGVLVEAEGTAGSEIGLHTATSKYASLAKNAYFSPYAWHRFDESSGAFLQELFPGGDAWLRVAPAGTNPISWINAIAIKSSGKVGINTTSATATLDVNGSTGYNQVRMRTSYTPTGSADPNGNVGDIAWDNSYVYVKTGAGWRRATLYSW